MTVWCRVNAAWIFSSLNQSCLAPSQSPMSCRYSSLTCLKLCAKAC
jgi:hypothetical protein